MRYSRTGLPKGKLARPITRNIINTFCIPEINRGYYDISEFAKFIGITAKTQSEIKESDLNIVLHRWMGYTINNIKIESFYIDRLGKCITVRFKKTKSTISKKLQAYFDK